MATTLAIDEALLEEARRISGRRTKTETVNEALAEYIRRRRQQQILALFGTIEFHSDFDAKEQGRRR